MEYPLQTGLPEWLIKLAIVRNASVKLYCWPFSSIHELLKWIGQNNLVIINMDVFEYIDERMQPQGYRWCYQGNENISRKENLIMNLNQAGEFIENLDEHEKLCYEVLFQSEEMMDEMDRTFLDKAIINGGEITFKPKDALDIIDRCKEEGRKIIGIEAFLIEITECNRTIQPTGYKSYAGKAYDTYDAEKYKELFHVAKNADAGHWQEAKQWISDRANQGWTFEITHK